MKKSISYSEEEVNSAIRDLQVLKDLVNFSGNNDFVSQQSVFIKRIDSAIEKLSKGIIVETTVPISQKVDHIVTHFHLHDVIEFIDTDNNLYCDCVIGVNILEPGRENVACRSFLLAVNAQAEDGNYYYIEKPGITGTQFEVNHIYRINSEAVKCIFSRTDS